jgi:hypothetical protein
MAKLTTFTDLGKIKDLETFIRFSSNAVMEMQSILNGKIEFDSNIPSQTKTVFFPMANMDLTVDHSLAKTNLSYLVASKTAACDVYNGSVETTVSTVTLRSSVAGVTVTLILF